MGVVSRDFNGTLAHRDLLLGVEACVGTLRQEARSLPKRSHARFDAE